MMQGRVDFARHIFSVDPFLAQFTLYSAKAHAAQIEEMSKSTNGKESREPGGPKCSQ